MNAIARAPALTLPEASAKLQALNPRPRERRRFRRVPMEVSGRMLDPYGREHDCRTADISPGDARFMALAAVRVGDRIVFYSDALGRLEGLVVRRMSEGEFAVVLAATPHKREKLAETLTWLMAKDTIGDEPLAPKRQAARALGGPTEILLDDGGVILGEILDFSLVGMAIGSKGQRPAIGDWVRIGNVHGRVARWFENGFAIDFENPRRQNS